MKNILLSGILAGFLSYVNAQVYDTANVTIPGTLNAVAKAYLRTVSNLTVAGTIDARDFKTMRDSMTALTVLDLSGVNIAAYKGTNGTYRTYYIANYDTTYPSNAIPQHAFYLKALLTSITLPNTITSIGDSAFCSTFYTAGFIGSFVIPSSVKSIGSCAFANCGGLTGSLTIPSSVEYIGDFAFAACSGLSSIIDLNPYPLIDSAMGDGVFDDGYHNSLIVPCGSINAYEADYKWNGYYAFPAAHDRNRFNIIGNDKFVPISASNNYIAPGTTVTFTAHTECLGITPSLQWQVNSKNAGTGDSVFSYNPANNDSITCMATFDDTIVKSNAIVINATGHVSSNLAKSESFTLYPNPNDGSFTIGFSNPDNKILRISIADITGKIVLENRTTEKSFNYTGYKLQPGVYFVTVKGEDSFNVSKMEVR